MAKEITWENIITDLSNDDSEKAINASFLLDKYATKEYLSDLYLLIESDDFWIREVAAVPLARLEGLKVLPNLFDALNKGFADGHDHDGLQSTLFDLLESYPQKASAMLLQMLDSNDELDRENAAWGLGFVANEVPLNVLIQALEIERSTKVKSRLIDSLASYKDNPELYGFLVSYLDDENEDVRISAITSLGYLGDSRSVNLLRARYRNGTSRAKEFIKYALENLKNTQK